MGGILIGIVDAFGKTLFPEFSMFSIFLAMVIILLVRPSGLIGKENLTREIGATVSSGRT